MRVSAQARALSLCGVIALVAVFSGCSSNKFLYNRLDIWANWLLDDYVTLATDQQVNFDRELDKVLDWHRLEELPRYSEILRLIEESLDNGVQVSEAYAIAELIDEAGARIQAQIINMLLALAPYLSIEQLYEVFQSLTSEQKSYEENQLSRSSNQYQQEVTKTMSRGIKRLLGSMTHSQEQRVKIAATVLVRIDKAWYDDRAIWIGAFEEIVRIQDSDWLMQLRQLVANRDATRLPEYQRAIEHNSDVILRVLVDVLNARNERQDRHLRAFINNLRKDCESLIVVA